MTTSNWGRWGEDDERGAANFATPEALVAATTLVRRGQVYALGLPIQQNNTPVIPGRVPPMHFMTIDGGDYAAGFKLNVDYAFADDYLFLGCHSGTHIDALSHTWYDGHLYNGHSANRVRSYGASRCGIEKLPHLTTRGVLLDLAAHLGVPHLAREHVITAEELEACADVQRTPVRSGDCVLIRTGWLRVFYEDQAEYDAGAPGIGLDAAEWLARHEVSAVGADNVGVERTSSEGDHVPEVHKLLIRDCGTYLLELLDLEELAADGVHEFLFVLAPLRIRGGVGSPVNPLAIA